MYGRSEIGGSEYRRSQEIPTEVVRDLELGLALTESDVPYSTAEGQAVEQFARSPEGKLDSNVLVDLLPWARVHGRERAPDELRDYISKYGLEAARQTGRDFKEGKFPGIEFPSQALDTPQDSRLDPATAFGPVVRDPAYTFGPIVGDPAHSLFPVLPAMPP